MALALNSFILLRDLSSAEYFSHFAAGERNLLGQICVSVQRSEDVASPPVPRCAGGAPQLLRAPTGSGSEGRRGSHGEGCRQLLEDAGGRQSFLPPGRGRSGACVLPGLSLSGSASQGCSWADSPSSPTAVPGLRLRHDQSHNLLMKGSLNVESLSY